MSIFSDKQNPQQIQEAGVGWNLNDKVINDNNNMTLLMVIVLCIMGKDNDVI